MTNPNIWFFAVGVVIGLLFMSAVQIESIAACRVLIVVSTGFVVWQYATQYRFNHGIFNVGLSLIPWVAVLAITGKTIKIPIWQPLVLLGRWSFSLYLIHQVVMAVYSEVAVKIGAPYLAGSVGFFLVPILSVAISAIFHRYVEQGLGDWVKVQLTQLTIKTAPIPVPVEDQHPKR